MEGKAMYTADVVDSVDAVLSTTTTVYVSKSRLLYGGFRKQTVQFIDSVTLGNPSNDFKRTSLYDVLGKIKNDSEVDQK